MVGQCVHHWTGAADYIYEHWRKIVCNKGSSLRASSAGSAHSPKAYASQALMRTSEERREARLAMSSMVDYRVQKKSRTYDDG